MESEIGMTKNVAVVIPCFKVRAHISSVLDKIGPEVWRVYVVDDCCPEKSGEFVTPARNRPTTFR
jgi:glycosyltransferase involved in cell wall biosynthesis